MSGLIEYYARRRRAQADKKAEEPQHDSWDEAAAETDEPGRPESAAGASAWTNGHVTNVKPINRGERRRRRDGADTENASGNGSDPEAGRREPNGRATAGGSPNLFDYASAEEHAAAAEERASAPMSARHPPRTTHRSPRTTHRPPRTTHRPPTRA